MAVRSITSLMRPGAINLAILAVGTFFLDGVIDDLTEALEEGGAE